MNIVDAVSKSIKEEKWLYITYLNQQNELTYYWIAIKDIDFDKRKLYVTIFNPRKSLKSFDGFIYFNSIKSASVINFTCYKNDIDLNKKIEENIEKCSWLNYDHFNYNILNYLQECNILDNDPYEEQYNLINGIDIRNLRKNKKFYLNNEQTDALIKDIYYYDINKIDNAFYTLAINVLSINKNNRKFVICYYDIKFNPEKKTMELSDSLHFNKSFIIDGRPHSLINYIDMDVDNFIETFKENVEEYINKIASNLKPGEIIDTMPDIMLLKRENPVDLESLYTEIDDRYNRNELNIPLKSFFGNITKRNNIRKKEPSLIIYDKKININQMRVIYNALKYPVTYVQGPPGTGKTQTILNVVLGSFYNNKTTLVCSSNNRPVDGIIEKLQFSYQNKTINFPYLRLGNIDEVKKATTKILELYNLDNNQKPNEQLLEKIKNCADDRNLNLINLLNKQEKRVEIEDCIDSSIKLINSFDNKSIGITHLIREKVSVLQKTLDSMPETSNEEIISLFEPLKNNYKLSQFLYYKSLQYIYNLKKPKYKELIEICSIKNDLDRALSFNKWIKHDENIKKLTEVFPVIFSTNISSNRLGGPKFMFNLVIMDEAGQCNTATALIPIAKAESLLLVGDPNQLKPVIVLEDETNKKLMEKYNIKEQYDYKKYSILDVMLNNDNISKYIFLKYHYRCGKKIINFSNQRYYKNNLNLSYLTENGKLELINIKNKNIQKHNEAYDEADAIIKYIKRNKIKDAFIITPFVNQKELINNMLYENKIKDVSCGTIHSIQGAEKNTIIFSPAISQKTSRKTFEWIKNNYELINVAVTRAKSSLVIACDCESINALSDKKDDLYNLIKYVKNNGSVSIPANELVQIEIGKSNGSFNENEFYKTISHFCSCHQFFTMDRNVKLNKLFKDDISLKNSALEFDLVLYENKLFEKKPAIVFEINGGEHLGNFQREKSDKYKMEICKNKNIQLIFIPNSFIKSYEYIADIIFSSIHRTKSLQQTLFNE